MTDVCGNPTCGRDLKSCSSTISDCCSSCTHGVARRNRMVANQVAAAGQELDAREKETERGVNRGIKIVQTLSEGVTKDTR